MLGFFLVFAFDWLSIYNMLHKADLLSPSSSHVVQLKLVLEAFICLQVRTAAQQVAPRPEVFDSDQQQIVSISHPPAASL